MNDMNPAECKATLEKNLAESMSEALDLKEILGEEREALERNDTMSLGDTAIRKQLCVNKIDELDTDREELSKVCGFGSTPNAVPQLAQWCDDGDSISETWTGFLDVAQACSDLNSGNGAIIRVRQSHIQGAINLLRGGTQEANTYGPTGRDSKELGTRSLAEA